MDMCSLISDLFIYFYLFISQPKRPCVFRTQYEGGSVSFGMVFNLFIKLIYIGIYIGMCWINGSNVKGVNVVCTTTETFQKHSEHL